MEKLNTLSIENQQRINGVFSPLNPVARLDLVDAMIDISDINVSDERYIEIMQLSSGLWIDHEILQDVRAVHSLIRDSFEICDIMKMIENMDTETENEGENNEEA